MSQSLLLSPTSDVNYANVSTTTLMQANLLAGHTKDHSWYNQLQFIMVFSTDSNHLRKLLHDEKSSRNLEEASRCSLVVVAKI